MAQSHRGDLQEGKEHQEAVSVFCGICSVEERKRGVLAVRMFALGRMNQRREELVEEERVVSHAYYQKRWNHDAGDLRDEKS